MSVLFSLPRFPSFRGTSGEHSRVLTSNNQPWMSTQFFKFKLITIESINVITYTFLQAITQNGQQNMRYDFMSAATCRLPYGRSGDREMTIVMKVERVVNLPYVDSFDFADGFDVVHVLAFDLVDENTAIREARALRYIYTDHFDINIQVTRSLSGWEVTSLSGDGPNFAATSVVTQHYEWEGIRLATRILNMKNSKIIIDAFITKIMKRDKFIWVNEYIGRRNKYRHKIYKKVKCQVYADIPSEINYNIFIKYVKESKNFKGIYIETFNKDRGGMIDSIMEFNEKIISSSEDEVIEEIKQESDEEN
ncbi:42841_t:CDS:2 [Gigaspora margarita]|uniref:42841_t:CDS:1 n=1 Tax=Gigaspora margarita TaxID=4874 RepID=A0ABM8W1E9_GIGMA|nr:42841_t:CDS:2 [Gigaspora margarita]